MQHQPRTPGANQWGQPPVTQAMTPGRRRSIAPWWVSLIFLFVGSIRSAQLELPAGEIWISFEEDGLHGESDSADMPNDLVVTVESASGAPVTVERLAGNLFSVRTNNTGHVP